MESENVELTHLLNTHLQHSNQLATYEMLVRKADSTLGMYHRKIVDLLQEKFDCSKEIRRFRVELNHQEYVLCYYPINNGQAELFPLESLELWSG